ncbi:hypothetical protein KY285_031122 [Solanum tuberosum]|nr:hypothetical protein KY285_031122 [Solanum tuberosum]
MNIGSSSCTSVAPAIASTEKPEKFTGMDFKRWQQKMLFYLTTLSLERFIKESDLELVDSTPKGECIMVIEAWKHSDFLCKNYILNVLHDDLYNVYSNMKTSKDLWDALEKKYKTEDVGLKKFTVAKFLDFKMVDNKCCAVTFLTLEKSLFEMF